VEKHVAKAKPKNNAGALRSLEAKLAKLCSYKDQTAEVPKVEAQIAKVEEAICDLASSVERDFGKRFVGLHRRRWRSSGDSIDYFRERDRLLVLLGEESAKKQKRTLEEFKRQRATYRIIRNRQMAEEFRQKKSSPSSKYKSDSALKAEVGKRRNLGRSASIEAINRGLKDLKA
jgi:hypothetical protein